jgi:hypothetical protein
LALSLLLGWAAPALADEPTETMDEIFEALSELLPRSLDVARFGAPDGRERELELIDALVAAAARVEAHAQPRDPGFGFLSRSLAADVRELRRRYARGSYGEARYILYRLTENCVACHSRLPDDHEFPLAKRFMERAELNVLGPEERARLQTATRQFDAALHTYEEMFADPEEAPSGMDISGYLVEYLTICIRVRRDLERPLRTLEEMGRRTDVPRYLRRNLAAWQTELRELGPALSGPAELAAARTLAQHSDAVHSWPGDRVGVVRDLVASSLLHRYASQAGRSGPELSEAYYLLGLASSRSHGLRWVPETEFYLETSIRLHPAAPHAEDAYAALEERALLGYTGSGGTQLPSDVQALLDELRGLIDAT